MLYKERLDNSPIEWGGDGYEENTYSYPYLYPDPPDDSTGWSEHITGAPGDKSFLMSSGPITLEPGAVNGICLAVAISPPVKHPAPDITVLQKTMDTLTAAYDCGFLLTDISELQPQTPTLSARLYPNPAQNTLNVFLANSVMPSETETFTLYNILGEKVLEQKVTSSTEVNIAPLKPGIYLYRIAGAKGKLTIVK